MRQVSVTATWELHDLFLYLYLVIYLSHTINNSVRGRFLWLRSEERAARARAFVTRPILLPPPLVPMCCTTPNGIAPSCRGRIARYNGPLHNGIRTCDVPRGRPSRWMLRTTRCEEGDRQLRIFGDRLAQDFSRDTTLSCIKDLAFPHRECRRFLFLSAAWHSRPFTTFWAYVWSFRAEIQCEIGEMNCLTLCDLKQFFSRIYTRKLSEKSLKICKEEREYIKRGQQIFFCCNLILTLLPYFCAKSSVTK